MSVWLKNRLARSKRQGHKVCWFVGYLLCIYTIVESVFWDDWCCFGLQFLVFCVLQPQHVEQSPQQSGSDNRNNTELAVVIAGPATGVKRSHDEMDDNSFEDFHKLSTAVIGEVSAAMLGILPDDVASLAVELVSARKVCCYGVGREKLVMNSLVVRLRHLGLQAFMVGEVDSPVVSSQDIVLASAGPSFYNTVSRATISMI